MRERVGKYEVLAPLSEGGMAQLLLGASTGPGGFRKHVVIKRILPEGAGDEELVKMFLDEARITAALSHPNIAQVYDLGEDERGLYVVLEFIAGKNLNEIVRACASQRAVLPLGFSVSLVHECALALQYAHAFRTVAGEQAPVIHRDVSPKNIMVTYDGRVKLLDFGIAKVRNGLAKTRPGTVKGTGGYMSPEQLKGEPLDGRSDIFSLGVVLWEMVCGRRLFASGTEREELKSTLEAPIPAAAVVESSVPRSLSAIVEAALMRERSVRTSSAKELAQALQATVGELFFEPEERAIFMQERFAEEIEATRALLTPRQSASNRRHAEKSTEVLGPMRGSARRSAPTRPEKKSAGQRRFAWSIALVLLGLGGVGMFAMLNEEAAPVAPAALERVMTQGMSGPKLRESVVNRADSLSDSSRAQGEVVLVLFPEAQVSLGPQVLGQGHVVSFSLPVGTHLVTVRGSDGRRRKLSLVVAAGRNTPLKLKLDELPAD